MRRIGAALLIALLAVSLLVPVSFAAGASSATTTGKHVPKVVFVVGPAGDATDGYRAEARAAAAIARTYTSDVVELYSPDATWPAVKEALTGASLVVYMGHGNGWPSRYHAELFPATENGFGLNPTAGGDNATHQYFGETDVAAQIKLARNAVVLLDHLCYASGNSEPGLPEGTLDEAQQRVDNYAAGFIKAGAAAVIAEAWSSPSYLVRTILTGGRSIQSAWQTAPSANDNRLAFTSQRSPGYVAQMDPETASSGFTRSIVLKTGLASADVLAGASGSAGAGIAVVPAAPTLAGTGLSLGTPFIAGLPAAGSAGKVSVPFTISDRKALPETLEASARWDPMDVSIAPADPATEPGGTTPSGAPDASAAPATTKAKATPAATGSTAVISPILGDPGQVAGPPDDGPRIIQAPAAGINLVVPEQLGDVVDPVGAKFGRTTLVVPVAMPKAPGRYRLTVTLHDADGVAYDAATQAMIPSLVVRVTGPFDGAILAAPAAELTAGAKAGLNIRVENLGQAAWGHAAMTVQGNAAESSPAQTASVIGHWVPLSVSPAVAGDANIQAVSTSLPIGLKPGASAEATLALTAPTAPGQYLLLLDVVTPDHGSLVATGIDPTLVRITVVAQPAP